MKFESLKNLLVPSRTAIPIAYVVVVFFVCALIMFDTMSKGSRESKFPIGTKVSIMGVEGQIADYYSMRDVYIIRYVDQNNTIQSLESKFGEFTAK